MASTTLQMENACTEARELINRAGAAVEHGNWEESADDFGKAVQLLDKTLVQTLCQRASSLSQLDKFVETLAAAERANLLAPNAPEPHYWQALAHEKMGAYSAASKSYRAAASFEKDLAVRMTYNDGAKRCSIAAADVRAKKAQKKEDENKALEDARTTAEKSAAARAKTDQMVAPIAEAARTGGIVANDMKMDWYQNPTRVSLDLYAKGVDKDASEVKFEKQRLYIRLVTPGKPEFEMDKELFDEVNVSSSSWSASKYKVEIRLAKGVAGKSWISLDKDGDIASASVRASAFAQKRQERLTQKQKEWNKKVNEELKDYKEDDSAMGAFREIYKMSDEDTRRAMMKSYSESGGQVLSTDWNKVKKEKVVYKPVGERDDDD